MKGYEHRGEGIMACQECYALVSPSDGRRHDKWHEWLDKKVEQ